MSELRLRMALAGDAELRHSRQAVVDQVKDGVAHLRVDPTGSEGRRSLDLAAHVSGLSEVRVRPAVEVVLDATPVL